MSGEPAIIIRFDDEGYAYRPGEALSGEYWIESLAADQLSAVEVSVLWYSEGKGDVDMAVHEFWRHDADDGRPIDAAEPKPFKTTMPNSPLSYEGLIVTIRWCVRVRVFLKGGRDLIGQRVFRLGDVPAIRPRAETD